MFELMKKKIDGKGIRIVFPEGEDIRILEACYKLHKEGILIPVIIGNKDKVNKLAKKFNGDLSDVEVIDMDSYNKNEMIKKLVEIRAGKNTEIEVAEWLKKSNYFATMLVKMGIVDGLVGGATYSTGDTVRPSLQIIKTQPGVSKVSSAFVMVRDSERYIMGDCAINISPTSEDIAATAIGCASMARVFEIDPKVALLSFSTMGSASGEEVEKVSKAKDILDSIKTDFEYDGELQFDAAFVESVGTTKAPNSKVAGKANTFIFPSLEAGNIGYKIAQRLGGFEAIGPLLIGLNAPVNDLSRGCNVDEIYKLSIITAVQSL
ncbi:MAG: phosphate acetyltransferase [Bacilli bacterium]